MKQILAILASLLFLQSANGQTTHLLDSTVLTSRTVISSIDIPWEITWGHDNFIWMTERYGRVSRVNPITGQQHEILNISSQVYVNSESGLLGLALHPDFANTPYVYIVYTYLTGSNIFERLVRYTYNGTSLISPLILLNDIPGATTHIGSRLIILPDNTMMMTVGDAQMLSLPQNTTSVVGKVLRMNLDGSIPADNPNPSSLIWSIGHRNTQGLWRAPNGVIYISEHGPTSDDELSILKPNRNYGWPTVTGYCDTPPEISFCNTNNVVEPIDAWTPTIAPSDIIWYSHPSIPEFKDKLLMTVLKDRKLLVFKFNSAGDTVVSETSYLQNLFGRLRDICISPSGKIYLATNGTSWTNTNPFTHSIIELSNNSFIVTDIQNQPSIKFQILPNPVQDDFKIIDSKNTHIKKIEIINIVGELVHVIDESDLTESINVSFLSKGIYFVKIYTEKFSFTEKIIKE